MSRLRAIVRPVGRPIIQPVRNFLNTRFDARVRSVIGLIPMTEPLKEDVFIVGYPKSGNTWLQHMTAGVIFGQASEYVPERLIQELVPDVHRKRYYKRYHTPMVFRTHHLPRPEYRRVVNIMRDGRDVMVSYFHHETAVHGEAPDFLEMVQRPEGLVSGKWSDYVEAWQSNPYDAEMLVIKYEDLKQNTVHELQRFCQFMGVERDVSFLEMVARENTFEKMRAREIRFGLEYSKWPKDKFFARRGEIGSYKDEMPPDVLAAFLQDATDALRVSGYPVD